MKQEILQVLQDNDVVKKIVEGSNQVGNLFPMEEALLLYSAFQTDHRTRIIVKKNRYEAQQLYLRLSQMSDDVLLFVMEENLRVQAIAASPEDKEQMLMSLSQSMNKEPKLIICNTAAFLRHLPDPDFFQSSFIHIEPNMEMDMNVLKEK